MDRNPLRPTPPTLSLPPIVRLASYSLEQIAGVFLNLRAIYVKPPSPPPLKALIRKHLIHDDSVPDSGYASAEDDSDDDAAADEDAYDPDVLRSDTFEREYAIRWLTAFTARADGWVAAGTSPEDSDARAALVDTAASFLTVFACDEKEEALTRCFTFPSARGEIVVELNDAPMDSADHTSVGLQSWASAVVLAARLCADPTAFGLVPGARIVELGAGTGLLSIAAAKVLPPTPPATIVATDFHPSVLANLRTNIDTNAVGTAVAMRMLDWERPVYAGDLAQVFDVVLAADVVYHMAHARWIKACVAPLLAKPGGVMWLMIAVRPTGRHAGMVDTVEAVFPRAQGRGVPTGKQGEDLQLTILRDETVERLKGVGRADEAGYRLYQIGWVSCVV